MLPRVREVVTLARVVAAHGRAVFEPPPLPSAQEGEVKHHEVGDILVFDDSKMHLAFNDSDALRTILLFDIARPDECPVGRAAGSTTAELASFIDYFK